jgi:transposase
VTTVTVLSGPERRRRWTTAEKLLRIVEESLAPAASVVEVARRYDVHPNLLTVWRRQARTGVLACEPEPPSRQDDEVRFAAVSVTPDRQPLTAPSGVCGTIEIEFAAGARMRITGAVDAATHDLRALPLSKRKTSLARLLRRRPTASSSRPSRSARSALTCSGPRAGWDWRAWCRSTGTAPTGVVLVGTG